MAAQKTPELTNQICQRIAEGEPLRQICREPGMPAWRTVYDWLNADKDFATRYTLARDTGADAIAEDILEIIDDARNDWMEALGKNGQPTGWKLNGEHVQRSKLRAEMRLKLLAKWNPKKYGDRQAVEMSGPDGGPISLSDHERAARVSALLGVAAARKAAAAAEDDAAEDDAADPV